MIHAMRPHTRDRVGPVVESNRFHRGEIDSFLQRNRRGRTWKQQFRRSPGELISYRPGQSSKE